MNTGKHGVEDFVLNESFVQFVLEKSPEDGFDWNSWISEHPEALQLVSQSREIITFISTKHTQPDHPEISEGVFKKIQDRIYAEQQREQTLLRQRALRLYWYAASVILLLGLVLSLRSLFMNTPDTQITDNGLLEVIVPEGERSQLVLPDGSKVWLNGGTRLKYPVNFLVSSREVSLSGEAYFDVTHQKNNLPFIVHLNENLHVTVLGTEFNVKSYESDKVVETTLVDGSIRLIKRDSHDKIINDLRLKPNEKAIYQKEKELLTISDLQEENNLKRSDRKALSILPSKPLTELEVVTAWKNNELVFQDETFESIAVRMERWYGMKITVKDESLKRERFNGKFVNNESIYQILEVFDRSESIQYTTKGKEIIITKRESNLNL